MKERDQPHQPLLIRIEEAARELGVSRSRAYAMAARDELPGVMHIGRSLRVHRPTLEAWLASEANAGGATPETGRSISA